MILLSQERDEEEPRASYRAFLEAPLVALEARLDDLANDPGDDAVTLRTSLDELAAFFLSTTALQRATAWLRAPVPRLSLGVTYFVEQAFQAIHGGDNDITLSPMTTYDYSCESLSGVVQAEPFGGLKPTLPDGIGDPQIIGYPLLEADTAMLCPIFVHEIGHAAIRDHGDRLKPNLDRTLIDAHVPPLLTEEPVLTPDQATARLEVRAGRWYNELLCDALAVAYLGPAYLFAAAAHLIPQGTHLYGRDHPPVAHRMAYLLGHLEQGDWIGLLENDFPTLFGIIKGVAAESTNVIAGGATDDFALRYFLDRRAEIWALAEQYLEGRIFTRDRYSDGTLLTELLTEDLPLVGTHDGRPFRHADVLLATWLYSLADDQPESLHEALNNARTQDYLSKGLEMSSLLAGWKAPAQAA